jgi:tetratricopeptide (TPR) repeat protein
MSMEERLKEAMRHHQAARFAEAETIYRQILAEQPGRPEALDGLGVLALQSGRHDEARQLISRAIAALPTEPSLYLNMGVALDASERYDEAIAAYQKALSLKPNYARALSNLGNTYRKRGMIQESIAACRRSLSIQPDSAGAHTNLAAAIQDGYPEEAAAHYELALRFQPNHAQAFCGLGACLLKLGQLEQSIAASRRALELMPSLHEAYVNMGNALAALGDYEKATICFTRSVEMAPASALSHWNLGLMYLTRGDFERGWPEYEWRLAAPQFKPPVASPRPRWDGSDLAGRRILLHAEQGLGDAIQFVRFVPHVARRGGKIRIVCHQRLVRLFTSIPDVEHCSAFEDPLPEHDVHSPLASLAGVFKINEHNIPAQTPYLRADPELGAIWVQRLPNDGRLKAGLCWAGKLSPSDRSIPPAELAPLGGLSNMRFTSLQKWEPGQKSIRPPLEMTDWSADQTDMASTAALIELLDLVITIDTSIAHLAAALGKKTFVLLRKTCDWRWLLDRSDSPWYPTMRLYRQQRAGEWDEPVEKLLTDLKSL